MAELGTGGDICGYRIKRVLGMGGMSVVYLVDNPALQRVEALKVLSTALVDSVPARDALRREAVTTAALRHRNIVTVYHRGETDDKRLWIAMECLGGGDAEEAMRDNAMTPPRALHIITEVAHALDHAHAQGVLHQDIKPANFLLGERGAGRAERVVLADFGAALTLADAERFRGPMMSSFSYTAPEVFCGPDATVGAGADIYSLGCTFFRLLTRRHPFPAADSVAAIAHAHLEQEPPRLSALLPSVTSELDDVMAQALAKKPADRFHSAGELAAAAAEAMRGPRHARPVLRPTPDTPPRASLTPVAPAPTRRPLNKRGALIAGAAVAAALAVALLGWWLIPDRQAVPHATKPNPPRTAPPASPGLASAVLDRAARLLPVGYPAWACRAPVAAADTGAVVTACGLNIDPGGPGAATYTLARDDAALQTALSTVVAGTNTVICPGNIQSPGPWRRTADPEQPKGTVLCGFQHGHPMMAWTFEPERLLAVITSASPDPASLGGLYTWWVTHS